MHLYDRSICRVDRNKMKCFVRLSFSLAVRRYLAIPQPMY